MEWGRVHRDFNNVYVVYVYIYDALFLKLSDGHTSALTLFSIKFFVFIQQIFSEFPLCVRYCAREKQ